MCWAKVSSKCTNCCHLIKCDFFFCIYIYKEEWYYFFCTQFRGFCQIFDLQTPAKIAPSSIPAWWSGRPWCLISSAGAWGSLRRRGCGQQTQLRLMKCKWDTIWEVWGFCRHLLAIATVGRASGRSPFVYCELILAFSTLALAQW